MVKRGREEMYMHAIVRTRIKGLGGDILHRFGLWTSERLALMNQMREMYWKKRHDHWSYRRSSEAFHTGITLL